jgi:phosphoribosylglycinamide formyltransferase-1
MSSAKSRIAIFASGNGSNAEAIVNYFKTHPKISVELILTNNPKAFVIERAKKLAIDCRIFSREEYNDPTVLIEWLAEKKITHVVLAGFLWLIPDYLIQAFPGKIINIHPSLLPRHGGKGMYGSKVHDAVKASGDMETGITIHVVNEHYDEGEILFQGRCAVKPEFTSSDIANCVQKLEYDHYPKVIERWVLKN